MDIPVGRFTESITLQVASYASGEFGHGDKPTWSDSFTVWANKMDKSGDEIVSSNQMVSKIIVVFRTVYKSTITERLRIKHGSDYYDIKYVSVIGINKFMDLIAEKTDNN